MSVTVIVVGIQVKTEVVHMYCEVKLNIRYMAFFKIKLDIVWKQSW